MPAMADQVGTVACVGAGVIGGPGGAPVALAVVDGDAARRVGGTRLLDDAVASLGRQLAFPVTADAGYESPKQMNIEELFKLLETIRKQIDK